MKSLNGAELTAFIKKRHHQTSQAMTTKPCLVILHDSDHPVITKYIALKASYAKDIEVDFKVKKLEMTKMQSYLKELNSSHPTGLVVQLPLKDPFRTDQICDLIPDDKDIDGLKKTSSYRSAAATAIDWLLGGYNIDLKEKQILIIGQGRLVGLPLFDLWQSAGLDVQAIKASEASPDKVQQAQVVVAATGQAGLITTNHLAKEAIVVDAGTAVDDGRLVGDLDDSVYKERDDLTLTPRYGGLGPLTIACLFDNLLLAARRQAHG